MRGKESKLKLTTQLTSSDTDVPPAARIRRWVKAALSTDAEITVRFVDEAEARRLNRDYRGRDYSTNVLSFLYESGPPLLGDIALCLALAREEAASLNLGADERTAHLLVHAVLHLQGYDHENENQANTMETLETGMLAKLGFSNPYAMNVNEVEKPEADLLTPHSSLLTHLL